MKRKYSQLNNKSREAVISIMGRGYLPKSTDQVLIYIIKKYWFCNYGRVLYIFFNGDTAQRVFIYTENLVWHNEGRDYY